MPTNHLIHETSPYLLQHAHNPVNWYPWGDEALQKAKNENKPILVSIGYSACHWCHVMERESFEDESAARIMNDHFINIKIDREERPDLDHIYMDAVQAMSGSGGWPLNVFLTPDKKPFYGGTYFPPVKAFNRSSWKEILHAISLAWKERKDEIESQAENLVEYLNSSNGIGHTKNASQHTVTKDTCTNIFKNILNIADKEWGGFGKAPKFPQTFTIQYLLQFAYFTDNKEALQQALLSIDKMIQGGIYDHVGGGFARYSTDREWLVPHFEKMLYDNALLIGVLSDAYSITKDKNYTNVVERTIQFIQSELMDPAGGFYAALDADSEGEEGKYYIWNKEEMEKVLGDKASLFCKYFDITSAGNWEGKNIPRILKPLNEFAKEEKIDESKINFFKTELDLLLQYRNHRIKPSLDDKIILSWNALMVTALCKAAAAFNNGAYSRLAEKNLLFLLKNFRKNEDSYEMLHTYKNGIAKTPAFLEDYAYLSEACINMYELTFESGYLHTALNFCKFVSEHFSDENSPFFFFTHKMQSDIIVRKKEIYDGATPSGNAIMANNLYKLSIIFDKPDWMQKAKEMAQEILPMLEKYPGSFGVWAGFILKDLAAMNEISVIGKDFRAICNEIVSAFIPNRIIMGTASNDYNFPILKGKIAEGETQIYLCKNYTCLEPFKSAQNLLKQLVQINKI